MLTLMSLRWWAAAAGLDISMVGIGWKSSAAVVDMSYAHKPLIERCCSNFVPSSPWPVFLERLHSLAVVSIGRDGVYTYHSVMHARAWTHPSATVTCSISIVASSQCTDNERISRSPATIPVSLLDIFCCAVGLKFKGTSSGASVQVYLWYADIAEDNIDMAVADRHCHRHPWIHTLQHAVHSLFLFAFSQKIPRSLIPSSWRYRSYPFWDRSL